MSASQTMADVPSTFRSLYWPVAIVLALLVGLLWLMGYGPGGKACSVPAVAMSAAPAAAVAPAAMPSPTPAPTPAPAAVAAAPVVAAAAAVAATAAAAAPPAEKVYFALNSTEVTAPSEAKLDKIVAYLKANAGATAVLSGFHDPSGNKASNEELALNRARGVRAALEKAGIAKERVSMAKPAETTGGGAPEEARRVEVSVKP
jgi:outer membrane protein OmpA-like peptidoglycan-associated protein